MPHNLNTQSIQNMNDLIFQFTGKNQGVSTVLPPRITRLNDFLPHIPQLNDLLQKNHAFIAGSASLSPYVKDPSIVPGDLDIWVPINPDNKCTWIKNPDYVESDSDDSIKGETVKRIPCAYNLFMKSDLADADVLDADAVIKFVKATWIDMKKTNKDVKYKDAMKEAGKRYKKKGGAMYSFASNAATVKGGSELVKVKEADPTLDHKAAFTIAAGNWPQFRDKTTREWNQDMSVDKFRCKSFIQKDFDDEFVDRCAYKRANEGGNTEAKDYIDTHNRFAKYIHRIHTYTKRDKKIQVIYINVDRDTLLNTFDLSFCATTWNGSEFYSLEPELTEQKIGYRQNNYKLIESEEGVKRENERIAKYKARGFTICENKESATALASALNVIESSRQALLECSLYKVL